MSKKQSLSKEQEAAVRNYKNQIKTITSFMEAVRKRATMYVGSRGPKGFLNIIREGFQNSIDQIMMKDGIATHVILSYDENSIIVVRPKTEFTSNDTLNFTNEFCRRMFKEGYEIGMSIDINN